MPDGSRIGGEKMHQQRKESVQLLADVVLLLLCGYTTKASTVFQLDTLPQNGPVTG